MKYLQKTINELNASKYDEDFEEMIESPFHFETRTENGLIYLYDSNENYSISYLDEQNSLLYDVCYEFGCKFEPITNDGIHEKLLKAIQKDFGKSAYIEWFDNVTMVIAK